MRYTLQLVEAETGIVLNPDGTRWSTGGPRPEVAIDELEAAEHEAMRLLRNVPLGEVVVTGPKGDLVGRPRRRADFGTNLERLKKWRRWRRLPWPLRTVLKEPARPLGGG